MSCTISSDDSLPFFYTLSPHRHLYTDANTGISICSLSLSTHYLCIFICMHSCIQVSLCVCVCLHACMFVDINTQTHRHTDTHTHTHTHTLTHVKISCNPQPVWTTTALQHALPQHRHSYTLRNTMLLTTQIDTLTGQTSCHRQSALTVHSPSSLPEQHTLQPRHGPHGTEPGKHTTGITLQYVKALLSPAVTQVVTILVRVLSI